jgi:tol-pal system protein YbgF
MSIFRSHAAPRVLLTLIAVAGCGGAVAQQSLLEPLPDQNQQPTVAPEQAPATVPAAAAAADTQRLSQLFYQLQVLQQEVQELRGLVEEQSYQLNRLARDQQEQYIDLDGRIAGMSSGQGRAASAGLPGSTRSGTPSAGDSSSVGFGSSAGAVASRSSESERDVYTRAFDLMKARQFDESAAAFNQLIADYPNGQYTPNAYYWLGELYLAQTDTERARQSFAQVLNLYPDHPKVPDTLYKLGVVYHRLGDNQRAIGYFEQVGREYPNSSAAGLATRYMAELK